MLLIPKNIRGQNVAKTSCKRRRKMALSLIEEVGSLRRKAVP
jgi:hypothetical protein